MLTRKLLVISIASLVLLASAVPLMVCTAMLQPDRSGDQIDVGLTTSEAGDDLLNTYLPIIQRGMCGEIKADTTWGISGSPYLVSCDVIVSPGVTLTIEAGVLVQFVHMVDDLIVSGNLQTAGTESAPITFQPLSGTMPGSWGRVAFMAGSSGVLKYTDLEYGGSQAGLLYIASDAIQVLNSIVQYSANTGIIINAASPLISGTQVLSNTASCTGGGLLNDTGDPIIQNSTFRDNSISSDTSCYGGGLFNDSGNPTIYNNLIANNFCGGYDAQGGGLYNESGSPAIQNNTITGNKVAGYYMNQYPTTGEGGGIFSGGSPSIQNNVFAGNQAEYVDSAGGGLFIYGDAIIQNNTFTGNSAGVGGGLFIDSGKFIIRNNIITDGGIDNFNGIITGDYNYISGTPQFVDPANGDFHLAPSSPCIDAGDPDHHPETDFDGEPRPMGMAPDIGADEFRTLSVMKTSNQDEALPGDTMTYTVTLVNVETFTLTNVLLTDTLPAKTAFANYQADGLTCTHDGAAWGGQLTCIPNNGSLSPGESQGLTVTVLLTNTFPTSLFVTNYVTVTASAAGDTFIAGDQASTWVRWCWVRINDKPLGSDLQAAIDASIMPTDVLKVSGYCLLHDLGISKTLTLQGGWSSDFNLWDPAVYTTTLDAQHLGRVINVDGNVTPTIEWFLITGGLSYQGGGVYISSGSPTIQNNTFSDNYAEGDGGGLYNDSGNPLIQNNTFTGNFVHNYYSGGGLCNDSGSPTIQYNIFSGNFAYTGAGLANTYGNPIIQYNTFTGNYGGDFGGGLTNGAGNAIIQNNIFIGNWVEGNLYGGGGLTNIRGNPVIFNNIFDGNTSQGYGGGLYNAVGNPTIYNNIVSNNNSRYEGGAIYDDPDGATPEVDYNDVWNNQGGDYLNVTPGTHDISADPLWVNPANGNYHLAAGSPCIDAGDPYHHPETDFEGEPRPMGLAPDIGVDETLSLRVTKSATPVETNPGTLITYSVTLVNMEPFSLTNVLLTDVLPTETAFTTYQADGLSCMHDGSTWGGQLNCTLDSISLALGESRGLTLTVMLTDAFPSLQYVINPVTVTASSDGDTFIASDQARTWVRWCEVWLNDQPMGSDLQAAIDASTQPSDLIQVSGHCLVHDLSLSKTLTLQGGWSYDFSLWDPAVYTTTLDGQGLGRVIAVDGTITPTIEGFVITGGNSDQGGGLYIGSASPIIQDNIVIHNAVKGLGGGLYIVSGNPTIQNNVFSANTASYGGGLYNDSGNPVIQNNTFYANEVNENFNGGGLYNNTGNPTIQNNMFVENVAEGWASDGCGGGMYNAAGNPLIQHNTFTGNMAANGGGVYNDTGSPIIQNNLFSNYDNYSSYTGGGVTTNSGNPIIQNNIFVNNSAIYGGGLFTQGDTPLIRNNTFYHNSANFGGGLYIGYSYFGSSIISNILVNNTAGTGGGIYKNMGVFTLDYNDVWNNTGGDYVNVTPGVHEISVDPLLVDPDNGDFHLAPGSPCIDAGDPVNYPETDFEGQSRPMGLAPDIGADEFWRLLYLPMIVK